MQVQVDNIWATKSALHMRVTVWGPGNRWRHRYDVHVPAEEIAAEAVEMLFDRIYEAPLVESEEPLPGL